MEQNFEIPLGDANGLNSSFCAEVLSVHEFVRSCYCCIVCCVWQGKRYLGFLLSSFLSLKNCIFDRYQYCVERCVLTPCRSVNLNYRT